LIFIIFFTVNPLNCPKIVPLSEPRFLASNLNVILYPMRLLKSLLIVVAIGIAFIFLVFLWFSVFPRKERILIGDKGQKIWCEGIWINETECLGTKHEAFIDFVPPTSK